ncbi:MAG: VanZ family protein [Clostridia bacterium]|nr:VanZ family protein [Clostridia bacterium]
MQVVFDEKVLVTAVITPAFEITQFIFVIGITDITDVLSNTLGGGIGIGIYALSLKILKGKTNEVLNVLAAVVTIFALLLIALLLINHRWVHFQ